MAKSQPVDFNRVLDRTFDLAEGFLRHPTGLCLIGCLIGIGGEAFAKSLRGPYYGYYNVYADKFDKIYDVSVTALAASVLAPVVAPAIGGILETVPEILRLMKK